MLLQNLDILTMEPEAVPARGAIRVEGGRIDAIGDVTPVAGEPTIDLSGLTALPGFVQGHVHLCQTLFRNLAEDLPLLEWLQQRIWPFEAAHDESSLRASARLSLWELLAGGCTTFQSMETTHGTEWVLDEVLRAGIRAIVGGSLMDVPSPGCPPGLVTTTDAALAGADHLHREWNGREGRVWCSLNPRFLLSCTDALLHEVAQRRTREGRRVHTHAAEHPAEVDAVLARYGRRYLLVLEDRGLLGPETSLAHCVHLSDDEITALVRSNAAVLHCPSTNLKLGSGIAPIAAYRRRGVRVALGSDGAPANNRLDGLTEMRQAVLLQHLRAGPGALGAFDALSLLTREGARALGFQAVCGTLAPGKAADIVFLDLTDPALGPGGDVFTRIVYGVERRAVRHVMAGGRFVVRDGVVTSLGTTAAEIRSQAERALQSLLRRAGRHR